MQLFEEEMSFLHEASARKDFQGCRVGPLWLLAGAADDRCVVMAFGWYWSAKNIEGGLAKERHGSRNVCGNDEGLDILDSLNVPRSTREGVIYEGLSIDEEFEMVLGAERIVGII